MATMAVDPAQGSCPVTDTRGAAVAAAAAAGQGASTAAAVSTAGRTTAAAGTAERHRSLKEFEFFPLLIMVPDSEFFFNFFRCFSRAHLNSYLNCNYHLLRF